MSILIVKVKQGTRVEQEYAGVDLAFVHDFVKKNWTETLTVEEVNCDQVVAALRSGVDSLELLRRVLE